MMLSRMLRVVGLSAAEVTPTPNPSPQGGGGLARISAKLLCSAISRDVSGASLLDRTKRYVPRRAGERQFPSPLWGGVRGGGIASAVLSALLLVLTLPATALSAQNNDPDWPCIQRKVPELSLGQIWTGPELPASANDWSKDQRINALVEELSARRLPIADAQKQIKEFAAGVPADAAKDQLAMLVQGLFDHMNHERSDVIAGIARYARNQLELAARLRKEASEVDALRGKPDASANEIAARTDRLTWETRIFEERVQSLTFVCEVPTLIEQRLYALAKTVGEVLKEKQ